MSFRQIKVSIRNAIRKINKTHLKNYFLHAYNIQQLKREKQKSKVWRKPKVYKD